MSCNVLVIYVRMVYIVLVGIKYIVWGGYPLPPSGGHEECDLSPTPTKTRLDDLCIVQTFQKTGGDTMDKVDLLNEIETQVLRLGLFYSREAQGWVSALDEHILVIILRFLNKLNKYYRKKG